LTKKIVALEVISCLKCNERIDSILKFKDIQPSGLALFGKCPKCGERMSIGELWKKVEEVEKSLEEWPRIKRERKNA